MNPRIKQALLWLVTIALLGGCVYALYATGFFQTLHSRSALAGYLAEVSPGCHLMSFVSPVVSVSVAPGPSTIPALVGAPPFSSPGGPWYWGR